MANLGCPTLQSPAPDLNNTRVTLPFRLLRQTQVMFTGTLVNCLLFRRCLTPLVVPKQMLQPDMQVSMMTDERTM